MAKDVQPIIIKKVKEAGHAHHGGAWKVAYADFVTAMMAFFLLLWLLNATTEEQKAGIADYFAPSTVAGGKASGLNATNTSKHQTSYHIETPGTSVNNGRLEGDRSVGIYPLVAASACSAAFP